MVKIGDTFIVEPKFSMQAEKYKCMVVEMTKRTFFIDYPVNVETGKIAFLTDGTQLKVTYTDAENEVFIFNSEVLGRIKTNIPMIELIYPPEHTFVKIQRRQFVRIETALDAAIHPENGEFVPFKAISADISAGGMALRVLEHIRIGKASSVRCWIALPLKEGGIQYLQVRGSVIRLSEAKNGYRILSVQFFDMTEGDTQVILRYVFEKQLEMKRKGIIN
jgi:c-di-GMP-binding flagellar brake protein YcgR